MNVNTLFKIKRLLLIMPAVTKNYGFSIQKARSGSKEDDAVRGDGRLDFPGKRAKYCSYTLTGKIIAQSTIQTAKGKGSAPLELKTFQNCLEQLISNSFNVTVVATDRNKQLSKWLRKERPEIKHRYDSWYFLKNI